MTEFTVRSPKVLLPGPQVDLATWPVVACDQYTSQPAYWQQTEANVGTQPSTLQLILPEVYLGAGDEERIVKIHEAMRDIVAKNLLVPYQGPICVERSSRGGHGMHTRHGIMVEVDLEQYDFSKGSQSMVRATEGTIVDRIPPRIRVRSGAPLELPHVLLLFDDPANAVLGPILAAKEGAKVLYDCELMQDGGHITGRALTQAQSDHLFAALQALADPKAFAAHYGLPADSPPLLFAVGDGNHSLATAKTWWQQVKATLAPEAQATHPARWALVELINIHDPGLDFEPIHRVLFAVAQDIEAALHAAFGANVLMTPADSTRLAAQVANHTGSQAVGLVTPAGAWLVEFLHPQANLAVGTLQRFLDGWLAQGGAQGIDYVHGADVTVDLGQKPGHAGFLLPALDKGALFATVVHDGALPRKTFSMGEAWEKRYYLESRKIT